MCLLMYELWFGLWPFEFPLSQSHYCACMYIYIYIRSALLNRNFLLFFHWAENFNCEHTFWLQAGRLCIKNKLIFELVVRMNRRDVPGGQVVKTRAPDAGSMEFWFLIRELISHILWCGQKWEWEREAWTLLSVLEGGTGCGFPVWRSSVGKGWLETGRGHLELSREFWGRDRCIHLANNWYLKKLREK